MQTKKKQTCLKQTKTNKTGKNNEKELFSPMPGRATGRVQFLTLKGEVGDHGDIMGDTKIAAACGSQLFLSGHEYSIAEANNVSTGRKKVAFTQLSPPQKQACGIEKGGTPGFPGSSTPTNGSHCGLQRKTPAPLFLRAELMINYCDTLFNSSYN